MTDIQGYLNKMTQVQNQILEFIDSNDNDGSNCTNLYQLIDNQKIKQNKNDFKSFLHLLSNISMRYQRSLLIFPKIEKILLYYKKIMLKYFSNNEIFTIFKNNKRCILFLFQEKMIVPNRYIMSNFIKNESKNYLEYCYKEIKGFNNIVGYRAIDPKYINFAEAIEQKKKKGENDNEICEIIRNDAIDDFISYIKRHNIDFSSKIDTSVYETNSFLLKKGSTLIEYAAFSGSVKIFKYLYSDKSKFDQTIWQYAIYGRNLEIIRIIEDIDFPKETIDFNAIYIESIKSYHKEISKYLEEKYQQYININFRQILKAYNFEYFTTNFFNEPDIFYELCHYDYISLVEILLRTENPQFKIRIEGKNALLISTKKSNTEIIELLLKRKEFDVNENSLLANAIIIGNKDVIQILVNDRNIKINSLQRFTNRENYHIKETNLIAAIRKGDPEIVKILLNHKKINVNTVSSSKSDDGSTSVQKPPLFIAVEGGNLEIIQLLLEKKGINVNQPSVTKHFEFFDIDKRQKTTVLNYAIENKSTEIVNLLIDSGKFNVNAESKTETFEYDMVKQNLSIVLLNSILFPFFAKILKSKLLSFFVNIVVSYIWVITNLFFFNIIQSFIFSI
ncbi:hypothetical protein M9Y10_035969 [Tritrichomonas musculus]|uniref:DUF3447 domain-containing protein n=1 Tax=Tritrichomonas musculus TaxID=1915356 RepID=A0ABR2GXA7_9EUKA